jgi:hypothetical protein
MMAKGAVPRQPSEELPKPVLIDTSAWILALREGGSIQARDEVGRLIAENRAATTGIVKLELLAGTRTKGEYQELKEDLESLIQVEIVSNTWHKASYLAYRLKRKGVTVPSTDVLIVAVAAENGCKLLHSDRHFGLIAEKGMGLSPSDVIRLSG